MAINRILIQSVRLSAENNIRKFPDLTFESSERSGFRLSFHRSRIELGEEWLDDVRESDIIKNGNAQLTESKVDYLRPNLKQEELGLLSRALYHILKS